MVPLLTALLIPLVGRVWREGPWILVTTSLGFATFGALRLLRMVDSFGPIRYAMGNWPAPTGIEYVVDGLNAIVLVMVAAAGLLTALWMRRSVLQQFTDGARTIYYAVFLLFVTGLLGITITGDLFNLYVFLEITSITSYVLIAMGRNRRAL